MEDQRGFIMEGELGDSGKSLSTLIENVPGIVYRCKLNKNWTMRYLSENSKKLTGYEPSDFIDDRELSWREIIHPDDRERVWDQINNSLKKDDQFRVTYRIITKKGEERWVWEKGKAVEDKDGETYLEGFITDITDRKEREKSLEEREKKVKELYEASTKLTSCRTKQDVYELAVQSAEKILDFYSCSIFIKKNGKLEVKYSLDQSTFEKGDTRVVEEEPLMSRSIKNKESIIVNDFDRKGVGVTQEGLKSGISVPIGDIRLLMASSKEKNYFDDFDLEMAKILASHINESIERIESEEKVKKLYEASAELERCTTREEVYELSLHYVKNILDFYTAGIFIKENGYLVGKNFTENSVGEKGDRFPLEEGIKGLTYRNKESILIRDADDWGETEPHQENLRSGLSVPIGDIGVLQAASKEVGYYDDFDLEMAKILASHINETIERIKSEEEKSLILETAEEHIVYLDNDLRVRWANRETADYTKFSKEELVGRKCFEAIGEQEDTCEDCPVERVIESGTTQEAIQKNGDGNYWLIRATPDLNEEGDVKGVVVIALDITQRKKAEEKLKENKKKIEALLDSTSRLEKQHNVNDLYDVAIDAIENILEIDLGAIFVSEDNKFILKAETSGVPSSVVRSREKTDGILAKTYETKQPDITDDLRSSEEANLHLEDYKSGISVPIGDFGVFQAMSKEKGHFDEADLDMLELLANHIIEAKERVELHKELERSEKRYRRLFEESPISIWEEDFSELKDELDELEKSGIDDFEKYFSQNPEEVKRFVEKVKVNDVNKNTLEIFGANSKKELFENFDQILRDGALDALKEELVAVAEGEQTFETSDFVNYTLEGEKRYFFIKWATLGDGSDYSNVIVSLVDITSLKRTQKKLRKSEKKYRSIFENTGTAMMIIEEDKTISLANEEYAELVGYPREEIEGNMKWPIFVSEKDRKRMIGYHEKRRGDLEEAPSNYEFTLVNRFGDARDVVIEVGMIPETNKSVASLMDITDYKKTFGALRESQEAFRILFENTDDPVFMLDENHRVKEVNDSFREMIGYEDKKIEGESFEEILENESDKDLQKNLKDMFEGRMEEFQKEILFDKGKVPTTVRYRLVKDHEENPLYVIGILHPG